MFAQFEDGVWLDTTPVSILKMRLTATMTVLRVREGELLVHSPVPLTAERREEVTSLGRVAHLYAPNTFHHQWLGEWAGAFPAARVHAPRGLLAKRPDLKVDRFHGEPGDSGFGDFIDEVTIQGFRLEEAVLVHRASRTAVVADLVHNIGRPAHAWTRFYTRLMGFYDRVALSRVIRWTAFDDRSAARRSVDTLLDHAFEGLIVGHGAPIARVGREALAGSTSWLPAAEPLKLSDGTRPGRALFAKPCG